MRDIEKEEKPEEKLEMPRSGEALFLEELGRAAEGEIDQQFEELTAGMRRTRRLEFRRRRIEKRRFCGVRTA